jgi:hypothetical protein
VDFAKGKRMQNRHLLNQRFFVPDFPQAVPQSTSRLYIASRSVPTNHLDLAAILKHVGERE